MSNSITCKKNIFTIIWNHYYLELVILFMFYVIPIWLTIVFYY